jgi:hypothetical protein
MKMNKVFLAAGGISLILLGGGCGKPTLTVLVVDNSASCAPYTQKWTEEFISAMAGNAALESSEIAIVQINANPALVWSGKGTRIREFKLELRKAVQPAAKPGSDIYGALELVRENCRNGFEQCKIVIVSDMEVYDPSKREKSDRKFRNPLEFKAFPKDAEILIYGLGAKKSEEVHNAWGQFKPKTFLRNSRFENWHW